MTTTVRTRALAGLAALALLAAALLAAAGHGSDRADRWPAPKKPTILADRWPAPR